MNISGGVQPDADGDSEGTVDRDGRQGRSTGGAKEMLVATRRWWGKRTKQQ